MKGERGRNGGRAISGRCRRILRNGGPGGKERKWAGGRPKNFKCPTELREKKRGEKKERGLT